MLDRLLLIAAAAAVPAVPVPTPPAPSAELLEFLADWEETTMPTPTARAARTAGEQEDDAKPNRK